MEKGGGFAFAGVGNRGGVEVSFHFAVRGVLRTEDAWNLFCVKVSQEGGGGKGKNRKGGGVGKRGLEEI